VTDLALRFQGQAAAQGSFSYDAATGTYSVGGAGADIWGNADQFTYAYKALEGNGTMIARVVSDDGKGANEWSKAGVMIRETLAAGSTHAFMPISGRRQRPQLPAALGGRSGLDQRRWPGAQDHGPVLGEDRA
jgi:hypothetical protein